MIRLRQIAIVTADLESAQDQLTNHLDLEPCYRDPSVANHGLRNTVYPIGNQFLELVTPIDDNTPAARQLAKRGHGYVYMALFQTDDLTTAKARLDQHDISAALDTETVGIQGLHLHPKDVPGTIVSIDKPEDPDQWPWAGTTWRDNIRTDIVSAILGLTVSTENPTATAARWANALGQPSTMTDAEPQARCPQIKADNAFINFTENSPGDHPGVTSIRLQTSRPNLAHTSTELADLIIDLTSS